MTQVDDDKEPNTIDYSGGGNKIRLWALVFAILFIVATSFIIIHIYLILNS